MKKIIPYVFNYALFMTLGHLIIHLGITSIYRLPIYILPFFNLLAISYTIKYPMERKKDVTKKEILIPLLVSTTIIDSLIVFFAEPYFAVWIVLIISNIIELYLMKPATEKNKEQAEKNIAEYYKKYKSRKRS